MAFLYPQTKHKLIPQAHSAEEDLKLATETKNFRGEFFQLLQNKLAEVSANNPESEDTESFYRHLRQELDATPEIQTAHQKRRQLQDRLWSQVIAQIELDRDRLTGEFESYSKISNKGKLELNPDFHHPPHQLKVDIHRMPGGYAGDNDESDFNTGAIYDTGVFLYGQGWFGGLNDELGQTLINNVIGNYYPELQPQRILDLGCSVGHSTLPYVTAYPDAEVWGIDQGASLLRYASARAKVLNKTVNFAQQNAEATDFSANSFDLVVSHILLHEIPSGARKKVFAESYRLLKPGGIVIHLESQLFLSPPSLVSRYFRDTEVWVNSEPFLGSSKLEDFAHYARCAGFAPGEFKTYRVSGYLGQQKGNDRAGWLALCAKKV